MVWRLVSITVAIALFVIASTTSGSTSDDLFGALVVLCVLAAVVYLMSRVTGLWSRRPRRPHTKRPRCGRTSKSSLSDVRASAATAGGGVYLGLREQNRGERYSSPARAVLIIGPPRSGKTSSVIIPTLLAHSGPVVSTSTKPDVAAATAGVRGREGKTWLFDPTGKTVASAEHELRWSPVAASATWDEAMLMARAMTQTIGAGTTDRSHWSSRAQALLAPLLYAAAVHGRDMSAVVGWVMAHELDEAGGLLEDERCSELAFSTLLGLKNTEERERSSIFSAAADALQAYQSEAALRVSRDPNFDPAAFARSQDTVYIHAPADAQAAAAPIVCSLLSEIRRATYHAHATGQSTSGRMLFALDEAANIAPLQELPQIASEGGGQGLTLLAAFQDLAQARHRWGAQADGFLTLFGTKLILPGVADTKTLEAVSTMLGEYDRQVVSHTQPQGGLAASMLSLKHHPLPHPTSSSSTQRTRVLSPGEISHIPNGHAIHLDGTRWELLTLTPAHSNEPWDTLTANATA